MSRHYSSVSSTASTASRPSIGGSVDPSDHQQQVVPTSVDLYASRPSNPSLRGMDNMEVTNSLISVHQNVRPIIAGRSVIINRSVADPFNRNSRAYHSERVYRVSNLGSMAPGSYTTAASTGVGAVMESRDKEKRDMQDLNERLANYLEKVRFLEAQNRNLASELERLKEKWGQETGQVKAMYQAELDEARKLLDDAVKGKGKFEIKVASLEDLIEELRQKLDDSNAAALQWKERWEGSIQRVSDAEAEAAAMRRRMEGMEMERDRDRKMVTKLQDLLTNLRQDLDNESYLHLEAATRLQTLEEELAFVKEVHEQEMKEMAALVNKDTTSDNRAFWKNEMGAALKEIQEMYEEKIDSLRSEMESSYNMKIQEFRTGATKNNMEVVHSKDENKRLKTTLVELRDRLSKLEGQNIGLQRELEALRRESELKERELERENQQLKMDITKLRAEIEAIMAELQNIMDSKLGLEIEIAAYRKLLEGEEHRLVKLEESIARAKNPNFSRKVYDPVKLEETPKYSFQRSSKGSCGITDSSYDGKYIILENTGRKDENLGSWIIRRIINNVESKEYVFEPNVIIRPNSTIRVWSHGSKPHGAPLTDIETGLSSWGVGDIVVTKLLAPNGEEKASYTQRLG